MNTIFSAFLIDADLKYGTGARIDDANIFVLAGGDDFTAVVVEGDRPYHIRMASDFDQRFARSAVPQQNFVVAT